jgi:hypothetical protein
MKTVVVHILNPNNRVFMTQKKEDILKFCESECLKLIPTIKKSAKTYWKLKPNAKLCIEFRLNTIHTSCR